MKKIVIGLLALFICFLFFHRPPAQVSKAQPQLWQIYDQYLKKAKYVDLTHTITPSIPVWAGFGHSTFAPTINPKTGKPYTYKDDDFEATHYALATDQLGTQLDPP